MSERNLLELVQYLYILNTSDNRWHAHLSHSLRAINFKETCFDPDVWIKGREVGYNYIDMHTDDFLLVSADPTYIFNKLKKTYTIKAFGGPKFTLSVTNHRLMWALLLVEPTVPRTIL